jgi:two-component system OmpR family response regulator
MSLPMVQSARPTAGAETGRVLVVDDEPEICGLVADFLGRAGYTVEPCSCGAELDAALALGAADLVLLDISMPQEDGLSIARRLRASGPTPIMMLTWLDSVVDRIVGYELGADDYLAKPFEPRELLARVRAVLRRAALVRGTGMAAEADPATVCFGKVSLDRAGRCLVDPAGLRTKLTATEYHLLDTFARNPNRVLTRDRLIDDLPDRDADRIERAVDIRVTRVRRKIEVDPARPTVIKTIRNVGYIYVPPRSTQ